MNSRIRGLRLPQVGMYIIKYGIWEFDLHFLRMLIHAWSEKRKDMRQISPSNLHERGDNI